MLPSSSQANGLSRRSDGEQPAPCRSSGRHGPYTKSRREASELSELQGHDGGSDAVCTVTADDDFPEQTIMAINVGDRGKVGCAYYVASEERLLCMEEVHGEARDTIERCKDYSNYFPGPHTHQS